MRKSWYGVQIFIEDETRRHKLLIDYIKPFKEEFQDKIDSYHFFNYTRMNVRYVRFRMLGCETNINKIRKEFERRLNQIKNIVIIDYKEESFEGDDLVKLYEYGSEAFFIIYDLCSGYTVDQRFQQYYQIVLRLLHLFFNSLGFNYFQENIVCIDKIFGNIDLIDTHPDIGSKEHAQEMLNILQSKVKQIFDDFKKRGYELNSI